MKYCWKCGSALRGTNPAFCSECGVKLDEKENIPQPISLNNSNYDEAKRYYKVQDYDKSLSFIDAALINDNSNYEYYNLKSNILIKLNRIDDAINSIENSLKIKENLDAIFLKSQILYFSKQKTEALNLFKEAENNYKFDENYYWKLAYFYSLEINDKMVIVSCDKALKINKKCGEAYTYRGISNIHQGNIKKCHEDFENSFKYLDNNSEEYYISKIFYGLSFMILTNSTLEKNPSMYYPPMNQALKEITDVSNLNLNNYFFSLGVSMFEDTLLQATEHNYFSMDVRSPLGHDIAKLWQDIADICLKLSPNNGKLFKFKGDLYGRSGFHENAVKYFDLVLTSDEPDFRVIGYKAVSLRELGRYQEAENAFKQMYLFLEDELKKDPRNIYLMREKAVTLVQLSRRRDAKRIYDDILRIDPNAPFVAQDKINLGFR